MRLTRAKKSSIGGRHPVAPVAETTFGIRDEYITLAQLLKMVGVIGTGGEAKYYLADTAVIVNGEPEQRRGRKLRPGDLVVAPSTAPIRIVTDMVEPGSDSTQVPELE